MGRAKAITLPGPRISYEIAGARMLDAKKRNRASICPPGYETRMPNVGEFHPIVVHFAIALLAAGVVLRIVYLTGKARFAGPAAAVFLLVGTVAAAAAVKTGDDAQGPAERIPGVDPAIVEHQQWGKRTRNLFLAIAALELAALGLRRNPHHGKLLVASAVLGAVGLFFVYETGEHGGELVYSYAGGVGTRTGEDADVERLLIAGLYHQSLRDREAGRRTDAARLIEEMARRRPDDPYVTVLFGQSLLEDLGDPAAAIDVFEGLPPDAGDRSRMIGGVYWARALAALGQRDSARVILEALTAEFPRVGEIRRALEELGA